jgi:Vanadium chloroperoxidase N-terminal domain/PAP2 superfamily
MNQVLYWNAVALEASRRDHSQGYANNQQSGPTNTSRALAIVHLAIHDAVAYVRRPGAAYLRKKNNLALSAPTGVILEDVIDGAAFTALSALYPAYVHFFEDSLGQANETGFAFGVEVADALLLDRSNDGANAAAAPADPPAYGTHRVDPYNPGQGLLGPHWGNVRHFVGPRTALASHPGEGLSNYLADGHYRQDYEEVREFGASERRSRTAEQSVIGVYWGYDGAQGIGVPPRLYNQIARKIMASQSLNLVQTAELFAEINVAMADAGIDAWHWKYDQNLWRPVVGIRAEAAPDGDPFWAPYGAPQTNRTNTRPTTPPFPAYPSGHATFGAALFQVLRLRSAPGATAISTQDVLDAEAGGVAVSGESFSFVSDELDGRAVDADGSIRERLEREFTSYARAIWENAVSRVYLGVHWRFDGLPRAAGDNIGGVPLGLEIGKKVHACFAAAPSLGGP